MISAYDAAFLLLPSRCQKRCHQWYCNTLHSCSFPTL